MTKGFQPMDATVPIEQITTVIYFIRDHKVMLDRDLAELYGVQTKVLKQAVRRNIDRFPDDFMFELTDAEFQNWRSQFVTSKKDRMGLRYKPMAFTEQGVAMLSSVLNSKRAINVNIQIMRAFVQLRKIIGSHEKLEEKLRKIEHHIEDHDEKIEAIFRVIQELIGPDEKSKKKRIGYTVKEKQVAYGRRSKKK
jgi:phage regulator Rha-like protein